jgi:hypothetical protein
VEIRNSIAQYEEPSPLFGFLRYRRRNVVIKYVPEECSRLVQGEFLLARHCQIDLTLQQHALPYTLTRSPNDFLLTTRFSL